MYQLRQITPMVPCSNLKSQIAFYRAVLGFKVIFDAEKYAFLKRDMVAIRLSEVPAGVDLAHPERQQSFYVDVSNLDALYESLKTELGSLPKGRVRAPFVQTYGQREFHVFDEDCTVVIFGETVVSSI
jgi:catechol 2,3-dioxygenase-like lactoylglutathione lyase family enzyme